MFIVESGNDARYDSTAMSSDFCATFLDPVSGRFRKYLVLSMTSCIDESRLCILLDISRQVFLSFSEALYPAGPLWFLEEVLKW